MRSRRLLALTSKYIHTQWPLSPPNQIHKNTKNSLLLPLHRHRQRARLPSKLPRSVPAHHGSQQRLGVGLLFVYGGEGCV